MKGTKMGQHKGARGGHVLQDRPLDDYGQGSYPVASLTRADKIYAFQLALRYPGFEYLVLKGSKQALDNNINAVGSGSVGVGGEAQIDPYDAQTDVSAQVTPAFKAVCDAAVVPLEAKRHEAEQAYKAAVQAARAAHAGWHPPKHK